MGESNPEKLEFLFSTSIRFLFTMVNPRKVSFDDFD